MLSGSHQLVGDRALYTRNILELRFPSKSQLANQSAKFSRIR